MSSRKINKNQFTFAFGQNSTKYYFLKYNNSGELAQPHHHQLVWCGGRG